MATACLVRESKAPGALAAWTKLLVLLPHGRHHAPFDRPMPFAASTHALLSSWFAQQSRLPSSPFARGGQRVRGNRNNGRKFLTRSSPTSSCRIPHPLQSRGNGTTTHAPSPAPTTRPIDRGRRQPFASQGVPAAPWPPPELPRSAGRPEVCGSKHRSSIPGADPLRRPPSPGPTYSRLRSMAPGKIPSAAHIAHAGQQGQLVARNLHVYAAGRRPLMPGVPSARTP